ncbi:hypothetical protein COO60DRAFT_433603 [Scenedesmus sp. NREL 46B-D3]|nr:hypothetical protein COO60DRAFT_433603 [Scenedesmus sp. NREL 46B-D3]
MAWTGSTIRSQVATVVLLGLTVMACAAAQPSTPAAGMRRLQNTAAQLQSMNVEGSSGRGDDAEFALELDSLPRLLQEQMEEDAAVAAAAQHAGQAGTYRCQEPMAALLASAAWMQQTSAVVTLQMAQPSTLVMSQTPRQLAVHPVQGPCLRQQRVTRHRVLLAPAALWSCGTTRGRWLSSCLAGRQLGLCWVLWLPQVWWRLGRSGISGIKRTGKKTTSHVTGGMMARLRCNDVMHAGACYCDVRICTSSEGEWFCFCSFLFDQVSVVA